MRTQIMIENVAKNLAIAAALLIFYPLVRGFLGSLADAEAYDAISVAATLLISAFIFADYTFSYAETHIERPTERVYAHVLAALIMFGTGALLEIASLAIAFRVGKPFPHLSFLMVVFYLSLVLYDFWDLERALSHKKAS